MAIKKGLKLGVHHPKITKKQKEVLHLLTQEYLTPKQITHRLGTSIQATYKTIKILKEKGLITRDFKKVEKLGGTIQPPTPKLQKIRLHSEQYKILLIKDSEQYKKTLKKCNSFYLDANYIRLNATSLEIYSNNSFFGKTPSDAVFKSQNYWNRFITRLEHNLKITLIKPRHENIRLVKAHVAETNNEIAKDYEIKGDTLKVKTREDGKIWLLLDNSFNLNELETIHPETHKQDMEKVLKQVNDWRDNNPPTMSEVMRLINQMAEQNKETAVGLSALVKIMSPKRKTAPESKELERVNYIG